MPIDLVPACASASSGRLMSSPDWLSQDAFNRPFRHMIATPQCRDGHSGFFAPFGERLRAVAIRQAQIVRSIQCLFASCRPSHVAGGIMAVPINTIQTCARWLTAHVTKERVECAKFWRDGDPASAVIRIAACLGVVTPDDHVAPGDVFGCFARAGRHAVGWMMSASVRDESFDESTGAWIIHGRQDTPCR